MMSATHFQMSQQRDRQRQGQSERNIKQTGQIIQIGESR